MAGYLSLVFCGAIAVALLNSAAAQTVHVVGDNIGWGVPTGGATVYQTWASSKTFAVGDVLTFNFATNEHDVLQVPKASFDACTSTNAIGNTITNGPANITLDSAGEHYYICTIGRHCLAGQKLAITVSGTPGASPSPRSSPTTPTTPSPAGNPADCAPTSAPTPSGSNTSSSNPGAAPDSSSSSAASASVLVSMVAIAMGFFF